MLYYDYHIEFEQKDTNYHKKTIFIKQAHIDNFLYKTSYFELSNSYARYLSNHKNFTNSCFALEIKDILILSWDSTCKTITYKPLKYFRHYLLRFWILHTFLPIVLEHTTNYHFLHASGTIINNKAILFIANSNGGKSTISHYFTNQLHPYLGDDAIAISYQNNQYMAIPSHPFCRHYRKYQSLGDKVKIFASKPYPIKALYILKPLSANQAISIKPLYGIKKVQALYDSSFIKFDTLKQKHLKTISSLANHTQISELFIPWDLDQLPNVYKHIINSLQ